VLSTKRDVSFIGCITRFIFDLSNVLQVTFQVVESDNLKLTDKFLVLFTAITNQQAQRKRKRLVYLSTLFVIRIIFIFQKDCLSNKFINDITDISKSG